MFGKQPEIYFDSSATTPLLPEVAETMEACHRDYFGNCSSPYSLARKSRVELRKKRNFIAEVFGCAPEEIIFTSGGTESNNAALTSVALQSRKQYSKNHILIGGAEHPSVFNTAKKLESYLGFELGVLPLQKDGKILPIDLERAINPQTGLVSVIHGNNEIGTLNNIGELYEVTRNHGVVFHTDAVQSIGWGEPRELTRSCDLFSLSAHKFHGPKGCGVLFKRKNVEMPPFLSGGSQENSLRAGTENLAGIAGMAKALELAESRRSGIHEVSRLRDCLIEKTLQISPDILLTGSSEDRLPFHASFIFPEFDTESLLMKLDLEGICASGGSACNVGNTEPNQILLALGFSPDEARRGMRFTLSHENTQTEVEYLIKNLNKIFRTKAV